MWYPWETLHEASFMKIVRIHLMSNHRKGRKLLRFQSGLKYSSQATEINITNGLTWNNVSLDKGKWFIFHTTKNQSIQILTWTPHLKPFILGIHQNTSLKPPPATKAREAHMWQIIQVSHGSKHTGKNGQNETFIHWFIEETTWFFPTQDAKKTYSWSKIWQWIQIPGLWKQLQRRLMKTTPVPYPGWPICHDSLLWALTGFVMWTPERKLKWTLYSDCLCKFSIFKAPAWFLHTLQLPRETVAYFPCIRLAQACFFISLCAQLSYRLDHGESKPQLDEIYIFCFWSRVCHCMLIYI